MVYLSIDAEEFDVPLARNSNYPVDSLGKEVSKIGLQCFLDIIEEAMIPCTFFFTSNFMSRVPEIVNRIIKGGNEIASHGCIHYAPSDNDIIDSKKEIEKIIGTSIIGYRQPKMQKVDIVKLRNAHYKYNASLNPTFIPGRYFNLFSKKLPYYQDGILQIPATVTPILRIPMFWYSLHIIPFPLYLSLCKRCLKKYGAIFLYFHPWEFFPLHSLTDLKISPIIKYGTGDLMKKKIAMLIRELLISGESFATYSQFLDTYIE